MLHWVALLFAGCLEIVGVFALKQFALSKKRIYLLSIAILFSLSFATLSYAMRDISMGVAYAIWTGIGASGGVIVGIVLFGEKKSFTKLMLVALIIASSIGLKLLE